MLENIILLEYFGMLENIILLENSRMFGNIILLEYSGLVGNIILLVTMKIPIHKWKCPIEKNFSCL